MLPSLFFFFFFYFHRFQSVGFDALIISRHVSLFLSFFNLYLATHAQATTNTSHAHSTYIHSFVVCIAPMLKMGCVRLKKSRGVSPEAAPIRYFTFFFFLVCTRHIEYTSEAVDPRVNEKKNIDCMFLYSLGENTHLHVLSEQTTLAESLFFPAGYHRRIGLLPHSSSRLPSPSRERHSAGVVAVIWYMHFSYSWMDTNAFSVPHVKISSTLRGGPFQHLAP